MEPIADSISPETISVQRIEKASLSDSFNGLPCSVESTITLIKELHKGQVDHAGHAYENHPIRVAQNLLRIFPDASDDMIKAALLHDTIEDCGIDEGYLRGQGYSDECIQMVRLVTKPHDDTRNYEQVIRDLISSGNEGAIKIKIADNAENTHPDRVQAFSAINPEKAERLNTRYQASLALLCAAVGIDTDLIKKVHAAASPMIGTATKTGQQCRI